ncbi:MAG: transglutaminase-like domain-containing protein [Bacteroidetes bacterium]|nr:transglutaminase-like domain-containing protein [Bacteroidota bacterium]
MRFSLVIGAFCLAFSLAAQTEKIQFGVVTKEQLLEKQHPKDPEAEAAILYKYQKTYFEGSTLTNLIIKTEYFFRYKIYNKKGFDWGNHVIPLVRRSNNNGDYVKTLTGTTLTLENDTIYADLVGRDNVFNQAVNSYIRTETVTFPNLKEGAILDLSYTIINPYPVSLRDVVHQFPIPVDRSEADIFIPNYLVFKAYTKGFEDIHYNVYNKDINQIYEITATDIPALKEEEYINNIENYRASTVFELMQTRYPFPTKKLGYNWEEVTRTIYKSDYFGDELKKSRYFSKDLQKILANNYSDSLQLAEAIFEFVKEKMTWNGNASFATFQGLSDAYDANKGNSGEINMILTAMFREAGFEANPVLSSTRDYGIPVFPSMQGFNYVIASIFLNGQDILFDATEKYSLKNVLPLRAINWNGKLMRKNNTYKEINLFPEDLSVSRSLLKAEVDENGDIRGSIENEMSRQFMLLYLAVKKMDYQNDYAKSLEDFYNIELSELTDNHEDKTATNFRENYQFLSENQADIIDGKIYFSPTMFLKMNENPFKATKREYPIDFVFPKSEILEAEFSIPEDYKVTYLPKSLHLKFVDDLASYDYEIKQIDDKIFLKYELTTKRSVVAPTYYSLFKAFFEKIVNKQNDKIIIEKIKS